MSTLQLERAITSLAKQYVRVYSHQPYQLHDHLNHLISRIQSLKTGIIQAESKPMDPEILVELQDCLVSLNIVILLLSSKTRLSLEQQTLDRINRLIDVLELRHEQNDRTVT